MGSSSNPACLQFANGWLMFLAVLTCSCPVRGAEPVTESVAKAHWIERLAENSERLLADHSLAAHERSFVVNMTCLTWGTVRRAEQAVELAEKHLSGPQRDSALISIVIAQSETDDVPGAIKTIERINAEPVKQTAWSLLVNRQARRGDIADALELLPRITDYRAQDRAREAIISKYLKDGELKQAEALAADIGDVDIQGNVAHKLERFRTRPKLSDVDYVPRTVAQAKKDREFIGISDQQVEFLWHTSRAEVAIHEEGAEAFRHAMRDATHYAEQWSGVERRNALMKVASLYARQGDKPAARKEYRAILASFLEPSETSFIDLGRLSLSDNRFLSELAAHLSDEELEQWIVKLAGLPEAGDLIGGIVAAKYEAGAIDWCEKMYGHCASPRQRFDVAVRVLQTYGLRE